MLGLPPDMCTVKHRNRPVRPFHLAAVRRKIAAMLGVGVAAALLIVGSAGVPSAAPSTLRHALHAASVQIDPPGCSGVLAENDQIVVTARHCVDPGVQKLRVRFTNGATRVGWVVATDEAADQAVLFLEDPIDIEPLPIVRRRQIPGTVLYFEGNPSRPRFQSARLDRIGRCPSLPDLPDALFTSIAGVPGDSGAPLVDVVAEVVGLVHGGARCHIATPADTLLRLVERVLERDDVRMTRVPARSGPRRSAVSAGHSRHS